MVTYNLISGVLALFVNENGNTGISSQGQNASEASKLIHNVSKCYQTEETVCSPFHAELFQCKLTNTPHDTLFTTYTHKVA